MSTKVALITGASCGIGAALAAELVSRGLTVYGLSRRGTAPEGVRPMAVDVTDAEAVRKAVGAILCEAGQIDLAVLAAGCGIAGALEHIPEAAAALQVSVNLLGVDNCLRALTPPLRETHGRILAIGSVAGVFPIPFQAHYSATKAAVESLLRAYGNEVRPFGISVGVAMLGDTCTGFTAARRTYGAEDGVYGGRVAESVARMARDEENGASPAGVARVLSRRLLGRRLPRRFTVGAGYRLLVLLDRLLPVGLVDRILSLLYG